MEVMSPGLGAFLQRVNVKEQMVAGQFHGFKILELRGDPTFWEGSDIRVGDVITSVNGGPIGHYDEAFRVWQSLATAPEIVVAYERRGDPKQLRIILHEDDESPEAVKKSASSPAAAPAAEPASAPAAKDEPKVTPKADPKGK
jgi:PDZ domain-containing secreted protein